MSTLTRPLVVAAAVLLLASALLAQEHSYTAADIENGSRLYHSSCAGCHGPEGDLVPGINLLRGQFRRATSDTEIMRIVQNGIAGTTMPPSSFTDTQAGTIVAFLRASAPSAGRGAGPGGFGGPGGRGGDVPRGDVARGKTLFDTKGQCVTCHRVNGVGPRVAPDLSDIGAIRQNRELQQKLVDPNELVRAGNRFVEAVMKDGSRRTGRLLNQDTFTVQLIDSGERLLSLSRSDLRTLTFVKDSPMPSYRDKLSAEEMADLVTYLVSLKGLR